MRRRVSYSTGRRLSGSTSEKSQSSVPWYTSGTPGPVSCSSFALSEFDQPGAAIRSTMASRSATVSGSSKAVSTSASSSASKPSSGSCQPVRPPASRAALIAYP